MTMEKNLQDVLKELNNAYLKSEIDFSENGIPTDVVISKGLCVFLLKYLGGENVLQTYSFQGI